MTLKRKTAGAILATPGFMPPLPWWNDAFVNLPLGLVSARKTGGCTRARC